MKGLGIGLFVTTVFVMGFVTGYFSHRYGSFIETNTPSSSMDLIQAQSGGGTGSSTGNTVTNIVSSMSPDQKRMLSALGIDIEKITPAMITCAETSLGVSRAEAIKNGSAISFAEKLKIVSCYK